jgi:diacylglycerol kinase (ATP)
VKSKNLADAFQHAVDGILHAYRTQRHVRYHFAVIILVLLAASIFQFDREKMVVLFFAISLVLICEMFNTALEQAIDLFTDKYHPLAKHAKDVAAGAVLIATLNALAVGSFLFIDEHRVKGWTQRLPTNSLVGDRLLILTVTVTILLTSVFIWKVWGRKGTPLQGGVVSGHSALAFFLASVILFTSGSWTAAVVGFFLAFLVSQSRIEGNIHTLRETVLGALLGIIITLLMFQIIPLLMGTFVHWEYRG